MTALVAVDRMYVRLGLTPAAATQLSGAQGMDDLTKLSLLTDAEVDLLCKLVRNPGGTTAGLTRGAPPLPNRGLAISMKAITNLKLACYYVRHQTQTSRPSNAPLITLQRIRRLRHLRTTEADYADPTDKVVINDTNWPKTLESLVLWITKHVGVTKAPLGYCLRTEHLAPQAPDLRYGHADSAYTSHQDEMCA